jgi:hypothetical protein
LEPSEIAKHVFSSETAIVRWTMISCVEEVYLEIKAKSKLNLASGQRHRTARRVGPFVQMCLRIADWLTVGLKNSANAAIEASIKSDAFFAN